MGLDLFSFSRLTRRRDVQARALFHCNYRSIGQVGLLQHNPGICLLPLPGPPATLDAPPQSKLKHADTLTNAPEVVQVTFKH
jgi:hypothetical protein